MVSTAPSSPPRLTDGHAFAALGPVALEDLIERLHRSADDLRERVTARAERLDTPPGAPQSDPVYQQLFFALARLMQEIDHAQHELARRSGGRAGAWRRPALRIRRDTHAMHPREGAT